MYPPACFLIVLMEGKTFAKLHTLFSLARHPPFLSHNPEPPKKL